MSRLVSLLIILSLVSLSLGLPLSAFAADQTIILEKEASPTSAAIGDNITYTYTITNNSTDNITDLIVYDDKIPNEIIPLDAELAPGENTTATALYVVKAADYEGGSTEIVNTATLSGAMSPSGDNATASASASVALIRATGSLVLTKEANLTSAAAGDNITYTYNITNNYTENVTSLVLVDDMLGPITLPATTLAAGENITATDSYLVTAADIATATQIVNNADVTGHLVLSLEPVEASATETVTLDETEPEPDVASLSLTKEADCTVALPNETITYTYTVSNNGTAEITALTLYDDKLGNIPLISDNVTVDSLAPGEDVTVKATHKVTWKDLVAGSITNIATAEGNDPQGKPVTASSGEVTVSTSIVRALMTKAQILLASGVPGKGIENAPGLQKPFNPNSQAAEHAGKKEGNGNLEQNSNKEKNLDLQQNQEQNQELELNGNTEQNQDDDDDDENKKKKSNNKGKGNNQD